LLKAYLVFLTKQPPVYYMADKGFTASRILVVVALLAMVFIGGLGVLIALLGKQLIGIAVIAFGVFIGLAAIAAAAVMEQLAKRKGTPVKP